MKKLLLLVTKWLRKAGFLLVLGFGASGFTSAFMAGCSASPIVGAVIPATISTISAIVIALLQKQNAPGDVAIQKQVGWVGGLMLAFFLFFFGGLYCGIQARTTYWAVGRKLLPEDMRKQVMGSDVAQAFCRLDLYHALQSQGLSDTDAAAFVERNFSPNYALVPAETIESERQRPSPEKSPQALVTRPKSDPYQTWPEIKEHQSPTPPTLEGIH